jgi:hypothetical protein
MAEKRTSRLGGCRPLKAALVGGLFHFTDFIQKLKLLFRSVAVLGPQSLQHNFVARRVSLPFELRREAFANRDNDSPRWLTASGQFSQVSIFGSS